MKLPIRYSETHWSVRKKVREEYVRRQKGMCYWCKKPLKGPPAKHVREADINWTLFPPNFRKWPVHLQHDHYTDLTEGAVHMRCNAYMWEYEGR